MQDMIIEVTELCRQQTCPSPRGVAPAGQPRPALVTSLPLASVWGNLVQEERDGRV